MILNESLLKLIRSDIYWSLKTYNDELYYTINDAVSVKLFWIDFLRNIFAKKFQNQYGIQNVSNFDLNEPVLIKVSNFDLKLPQILESIFYFSDYKQNEKTFVIKNLTLKFSLIMTIIIYVILLVLILILPSFSTAKFMFEKKI